MSENISFRSFSVWTFVSGCWETMKSSNSELLDLELIFIQTQPDFLMSSVSNKRFIRKQLQAKVVISFWWTGSAGIPLYRF